MSAEDIVKKLEIYKGTFINMSRDIRETDPKLSYSFYKVSELCEEAAEELKKRKTAETMPEWEGDPGNGYWKVCGECHGQIREEWKYCPHCGYLINWHGWEYEDDPYEAMVQKGLKRWTEAADRLLKDK